MDFLIEIIKVVLFTAFLVSFLDYSGLRNLIVMKGSKLISKLFSCDFCLAFWFSVAVSFLLYIFVKDERVLIIPFLATPLIRTLL